MYSPKRFLTFPSRRPPPYFPVFVPKINTDLIGHPYIDHDDDDDVHDGDDDDDDDRDDVEDDGDDD